MWWPFSDRASDPMRDPPALPAPIGTPTLDDTRRAPVGPVRLPVAPPGV